MRLVQLLPVKPQTRARLVHSQHHLSVDFCLDNGLLRLPALQLLPQQLELLIGFAQRRLLREYLVRLGPARTNKQPQLLTACTLEFPQPTLNAIQEAPTACAALQVPLMPHGDVVTAVEIGQEPTLFKPMEPVFHT